MVEYIENGDAALFDGLSFRKDKKTGYYLNAKTHKRLHVYVWEYFNGKVPKGYHVHHKDHDKTNNEIDNLTLLSASEHSALHSKEQVEKHYQDMIKNLKDNAIPKASEWHGSKEGKEWHKRHYEKTKAALHKQGDFICENCGKPFTAEITGNNRFCSNNCKMAYRRKSGVDNETRECECCGKEFITNKYSKAKTCSRQCRSHLRYNKISQENWFPVGL